MSSRKWVVVAAVVAPLGGLLSLATVTPGRLAWAAPPSLSVTKTVETGSMPKAVTVSPDGKSLVVTNFGFWKTRNLYWYDPVTLAKIGQTDFDDKDGNAVEAVFSPDSKTLYTSNFNGNNVKVVDVATKKVTKTVDVGLRPKIVVLSPDGTKLMVANWDSYSSTIYDTKDWKQLYKLKAGEHPRGIAITGGPNPKAYIAGFEGDELDIYEGADFGTHKKIKACRHIRHMTLSPDSKILYLSCYYHGQLGVWDIATDKMTKLVQIGQEPKSSAVSTDGRWVFIANFGKPDQDSISVVDTSDWKQRYIKVPKMDQGCGLALSPDQRTVWVTGWNSRTLHSIDVGPLGIKPAAVASASVSASASVVASAAPSGSAKPSASAAPKLGTAPGKGPIKLE